ncbi:pilus assembly protein [Vibrio sp. HDW18]|uniref:TadE family protein n=1 Tax=Vibrio TaxID=662 RepID=UPI001408A77B|nr:MULTISPECIES: TadE family protein [unclassified Vibrio]QIL85347.1 pilus assembly protein [Vibrio sp. HDW18]
MRLWCSKKQSGVATIEFVGGFFAFWLMCMAWVEMSFLSYVSSLGDLAIASAARETKKVDGTYYQAQFKTILEQQDSLWSYIVSADKFQYSIQYVKKLDDLHNYDQKCLGEDGDQLNCNDPKDMAIAVYSITYDYQPIFNFFLNDKTVFAREAIVIQEYQREKFTR